MICKGRRRKEGGFPTHISLVKKGDTLFQTQECLGEASAPKLLGIPKPALED